MADDNKLLYTLEIKGLTDQLKQLADLNDKIAEQRAEIKKLQETDKSAAEERKVQLKQSQDQYRQLSKEVKAEKDAVEAGTKTLAQKRAELARLNKELDNTAIGSERFKQLQVESKKLRSEINGADEAVGKFQGNVGNYKNAVIDAFQQMGINVKGLTGNIDKATSAIQMTTGAIGGTSKALRILKIALISTGIGAIVVAVGLLVAYLTSTQAGLDKINKILKPLGTVMQRVLGIAQKLGEALFLIVTGKIATGWEKFKETLAGAGDELSDAWKDGQRLFDISVKIDKARLKLAENEGRIKRELEEQRAIISDVTKTDAQRKKAGEDFVRLNRELLALNEEISVLELEQLVIKQEQNDTDREGNIERAQKEQEINELRAAAFAREKEVKTQIAGIDKKAAEDRIKLLKEEGQLNQQLLTDLQDNIKRVLAIKKEIKKNAEDVIFRLTDEEIIDDIPNVIQSVSELALQERQLAIDTTEVIKGTYTQRLEALKALYDAQAITDEQYANRKKQINELILDDTIESLRGVAREGSEIGRALFVFEKVLAVRKAFLAITEGTANTAKVGFPQNIPLLIGFVAQVAGLISAIKGVAAPAVPKFATGVIGLQGAGTETSDSIPARLSKGESVMTARATRVFAPVLADMERAVGNRPNFDASRGRFATGLIGSPRTDFAQPTERIIRETIKAVSRIPVVVAEGDITATWNKVRRINVAGDL